MLKAARTALIIGAVVSVIVCVPLYFRLRMEIVVDADTLKIATVGYRPGVLTESPGLYGVYMFTMLLLVGVLPILILVPLNVLLIRKLWTDRMSDKRRVTYMIVVSLIAYVILRLPLTIKNIILMYLEFHSNPALQAAIHTYATPALLTVFMINPAINLVLYCCAGKDFRDSVKVMLKEWRGRLFALFSRREPTNAPVVDN